jgi:signal transduction histidine kinase
MISAGAAVAPRSRGPVRLAWALWAATLGLVVVYAVVAYLDRGVQLHVYGYLGVIPIDCLAFGTIGAIVASRFPHNAIGWIFLAVGMTLLITSDAQLYAVRGLVVRPGSLPAARFAGWLGTWFWGPGVALTVAIIPLLFPDGRPATPFWRRWLWTCGIVVAFQAVAAGLAAIPDPRDTVDLSGQFSETLKGNSFRAIVFNATYVLIVPLAIGSTVSLFRRRRGADNVARQQLKYFLYAGVVVAFGIFVSAIGNTVGRGTGVVYDASASILVTSVAAVPVAVGLAMLRYRLYDIDVVISRTIVYGAMAAVITAMYVGIVVGVGSLVGSAGKNNLLLSIVATAVVALVFQPLRGRLQAVANRLVYGQRATPYEVLSTFSEGIGETYADHDVLARMARLLGEATDASRADVWVRVGTSLRPATTWPEGQPRPADVTVTGHLMPSLDAPVAVPVRHAGELLGAITLAKRQGAALTPVEAKLVDDLARQAGLVLRTTGLTESLKQRVEELRSSRERLVAAQDQERRRLERNLHDGAQQHLVALKVKLGLLRAVAARDTARAEALVEELSGDADEAIETLRDLARGIYPPLLADKGLGPALEAQARKATLPVAIDAEGVERYPQAVEAAVYFCVLEALQNVQKYAGATVAEVKLRANGTSLSWEVRDDGAGFDPKAQDKGSGLQNMEDRLDALGGTLVIESSRGRGTAVQGALPLG